MLRRLIANRLAAAAAAALLVAACGGNQQGQRYSRAEAQETLERLERPGLVLGEFGLPPNAVIDGDTIRVVGLDATLRLLAIDTEEAYKRDIDRRRAEADFDAYLAKALEDGDLDKFGTPMGEEATRWTEEFFADVDTVRLERDHPKEIRGHYNRYLVYAFKQTEDGEWLNFNLESVRAGMSPYFSKYGYSRRFHDEFVAAQREAREAQRGIWDPNAHSYGIDNYDFRLAVWNARADFLRDFEAVAEARDDYIVLTHWDALLRLGERVGEEVHVFGLVGSVDIGDGRRPTRVNLSRRRFDSFPIIFWDNDVFLASGIKEHKGHFVSVRGVVEEYTFPSGDRSVLQIVVHRPSQVAGSQAPFIEAQATAMGEAR
jgi:endonuclease YncB( thermonuclease family)